MAKQDKPIIDPSWALNLAPKPALDKSQGPAAMFVNSANDSQKDAAVEEPKQKHRGRKKKYDGQTKDLHIVISQERYESIQQMAGFSRQTITKFIESQLEELYEKEWKDVILQLNQINYKRQAETKNQKMIP